MSRAGRRVDWLLVVVTGALAVRVAAAAARPPWHDEYFTAWMTRLSLPQMLAALRLDSGPPLPYLLAKLLTLFGLEPIAAARAISVAAGTAAVALAMIAARRFAGERVGLGAGVLLAIHPLAVSWSAEGRSYALLLLAACLGWASLERLAAGRGGGLGLGAATALACWSHGLGPVLAGASLLAALCLSEATRRTALGAIAAGLVVFLPWLPVALGQPPAAVAWMSRAWRALPVAEQIFTPVRLLPPVAGFATAVDLPRTAASFQIAAALLVVALLTAARPSRRLLALVVAPAAAVTALAWLGLPALYPSRAEALYLAPFLGCLAAGGVAGWRRWALGGLVLGGTVLSAAAIVGWAQAGPTPEQLLAKAILARTPSCSTVVVAAPWWLRLNEATQGSGVSIRGYPSAVRAHPGWYVAGFDRPSSEEAEALATELTAEARSHHVVVVIAEGDPSSALLVGLARRFGLRPTAAVLGAVLWAPPAGVSPSGARTTTPRRAPDPPAR